MRKLVRGILIGAAGLALAACDTGTAAARPAAHTLTIEVDDNSPIGSSASDPLASGPLTLTVTNQAGTVVAADPGFDSAGSATVGTYTTYWKVHLQVPVEAFYRVAIAQLGSVTYSLSQVRSHNWYVTLSYG